MNEFQSHFPVNHEIHSVNSSKLKSDRYRTEPLTVRTLSHVRIPLSDGVELAARIWLPESAESSPVPAVLEYIPYRKNDMTAPRDLTIHPEFARAGYVSIRVDLRGAGDSTGVMTDEYSETELSDGLEVLRWIAAQPWSNGKVGIIGKSWGGFNGLQLAALRPPELAAVITVCSTDDRYADDVHYNGGAIVADQMLSWASTMWAYNARPQDPDVMGDGWREDWVKRIDNAPVNVEDWLGHQARDDYWKHASVCEDPTAIQVPVLAVGGLADEYRTTLFRLMEQATTTVHALLGPWSHNYPHQGVPGPAIDFIAEATRWWDHWMLDADNGVEDQPQLRAYIPESVPLGSDSTERPGRWVAEPSWPSPHVTQTAYAQSTASITGSLELSSTTPVGFTTGSWLQFGPEAGQPIDQKQDDAQSLTLDWDVNEDGLEILGTPEVELEASSDHDRGVVAVRLCDVSPTGESRLITMGLFNLNHSESHEHPKPLVPGVPVKARIKMLATAHRLAPGHKLRLAVSASCWPLLWPSPEETTISVHNADLHVPRRRSDLSSEADTWRQPELELPPTPPKTNIELSGNPMRRELHVDLVTGDATVSVTTEDWQTDHATGLYYYTYENDTYSRSPRDPQSAEAVCSRIVRYIREPLPSSDPKTASDALEISKPKANDWDVEIRTESRMNGDGRRFTVTNRLEAYEHGKRVHGRATHAEIPRYFN